MGEQSKIPYNIEAEQALLGILLYEPRLLSEVAGLRAIDFFDGVHQLIFAAMQNLGQAGGVVTSAAIAVRLQDQGEFAKMGGGGFLFRMADKAPGAHMLAHYAALVGDLSARRDLVRLGEQMATAAASGKDDAEALIEATESALARVAVGAGVTDHMGTGTQLCEATVGVIDGTHRGAFVPTHIAAYDDKIGGLVRGRVNIFAGRPSMGKSAFAVSMALAMARKGLGVAIFSLEMDRYELAARMACAAAYREDDIDNPMYFLANKGELSEPAKRNMYLGAQEVCDLPVYFDDRAGLKPSQIISAAKRVLRQWEKRGITPGCLIVDHLTIVKPDFATGNKVVDIGDISGSFRDAARDLDVAFVPLCQLSRQIDSREVKDKKPDLSDLRWSGEIEQDAAQVTFIYRPEKYLKEPEDANLSSDAWLKYADDKMRWANRLLLCNRKNRGGPTMVDTEHGINLGCNAIWEIAA